jgi:hypothetical protein
MINLSTLEFPESKGHSSYALRNRLENKKNVIKLLLESVYLEYVNDNNREELRHLAKIFNN